MRSRESALRSKRFEADEKSRKVQGLEQMIREFQQIATDLERQVQAEEERTGVRDRTHFAYSTFAKAATQRRNNLLASIADLRVKLEDATRERDEAVAELALTEVDEPRDQDRTRRTSERPAAVASLR
jgi:flagellar protein FliJ